MNQTKIIAAIAFLAIFSSSLFAQQSSRHSVSFQTMVRLDNLFPREPVSISGQYELAILDKYSLWTQFSWFRDPLILDSNKGAGGVGTAVGFRYYFEDFHKGWYIGPFFDLVRFRSLGDSKAVYGENFHTTFDFGLFGGHKWTTGPLVFDLALRTAFFSPESPSYGGYFPSARQSRFNSHLLISIGYGF